MWKYVTWFSIIVLCAIVILEQVRLNRSDKQLASAQETLQIQHEAIDRNNQTLIELCRANRVQLQTVATLNTLVTVSLPHAAPQIRSAYRDAINALRGYQDDLLQQTACPEVRRP